MLKNKQKYNLPKKEYFKHNKYIVESLESIKINV